MASHANKTSEETFAVRLALSRAYKQIIDKGGQVDIYDPVLRTALLQKIKNKVPNSRTRAYKQEYYKKNPCRGLLGKLRKALKGGQG